VGTVRLRDETKARAVQAGAGKVIVRSPDRIDSDRSPVTTAVRRESAQLNTPAQDVLRTTNRAPYARETFLRVYRSRTPVEARRVDSGWHERIAAIEE
jgi:hypothetical protein